MSLVANQSRSKSNQVESVRVLFKKIAFHMYPNLIRTRFKQRVFIKFFDEMMLKYSVHTRIVDFCSMFGVYISVFIIDKFFKNFFGRFQLQEEALSVAYHFCFLHQKILHHLGLSEKSRCKLTERWFCYLTL